MADTAVIVKKNPNSELVVMNFLRTFFADRPNFGVGTTFPSDLNSIKDGFIQISVVAGGFEPGVPIRNPVIQVDCWVPSINNAKPKWEQAATIAEDVIEYISNYIESEGVKLSWPSYKDAAVLSCRAVTESRRITNDPAGHARFNFDMVVHWVTL